jgi:carbon-monoxide dehydrogenase large subunit
VAQGIAQALFEAITYDEHGTITAGNLLTYLVPSAVDMTSFTSGRISTPCPNNALGAKGIGESGAVGAPPAVVNAVVDALAPFGVEHIDMPLSPERVWRAMHEGIES